MADTSSARCKGNVRTAWEILTTSICVHQIISYSPSSTLGNGVYLYSYIWVWNGCRASFSYFSNDSSFQDGSHTIPCPKSTPQHHHFPSWPVWNIFWVCQKEGHFAKENGTVWYQPSINLNLHFKELGLYPMIRFYYNIAASTWKSPCLMFCITTTFD